MTHPQSAPCVVHLRWHAGVSKNARWRRAPRGVFLSAEAAAWQTEAAFLIRQAWRQHAVEPVEKLWLAIRVILPHRRSDPINVLDAVADAVQLATDVNDRIYAIALLDWHIDRGHAPEIHLALAATAGEARQALSG